jgi:hypothetical protein
MLHALYTRISANELMILSRYGDPEDPHVRNLGSFCRFSQRIEKAVVYLILNTDSVTKRKELVMHLIRVIEVRVLLLACVFHSIVD